MDPMSFLRAQLDRVVAAVLAIAGIVTMLVGWLGTSRTVYPAEQIPYVLSGGLVGLLLIAVGATLWISADLRDEWRKLDRLEEILRERLPAADADPAPTPGGENGDTPSAPRRQRPVRRALTQ
jgi:hypothetical protein